MKNTRTNGVQASAVMGKPSKGGDNDRYVYLRGK